MKKLTNTLIFTLLFTGLSVYNASAFSGEGSGTEADPYQITTVEQLQEMNDDLTAHYILVNDIDASATSTWNGGKGFVPVGYNFSGSLDGRGYSIINLYSYDLDIICGLFSTIASGGEISNLFLTNCIITPSPDQMGTGAIAGKNSGSIINCHTSGTVTGNMFHGVGGVAGINYGLIENSGSSCDVGDATNYPNIVGGLAGRNEGQIINCSTTGNIIGKNAGGIVAFNASAGTIQDSFSESSVDGNADIGGFTGKNFGTIDNCYAKGNICQSIEGLENHGGFAGSNYGDISNCYSTGNTIGSSYSGGFVGLNDTDGTIINSYSEGSVSHDGLEGFGGFVGNNNGTINNCFSRCDLDGTGDYVAGFAGINAGLIYSSYSTGSVAGASNLAGFCSLNTSDISNCFWDKETSGQSASAGGAGKTTTEMKDVSTFTSTATSGLDNPWDFVDDPNDDTGSQDYWSITQGINSGYPYLKCQEPSGNIFYVDKNAAGLRNGLSWTNAYSNLQDALNDKWLEQGDTVWVADATYLPDEGTGYTAGARDTSFRIPDGVELYGGFSGTETSHEQRDPDANITILSGDIGSPADAADNSIHVLTAGNNAIIDGFTIKHGNANGSNEQSLGGGIYLKENSTGIKIENCTLRENNAGQGGAVSADGFVDFSISSCIFYANTATHGAAVHCENSEGNIYYSTFAENTASNYGAGLYYWGGGSGSPEIRNCTFYQNEAPSGASIHCRAAGINAQVMNSLHYGSTGDDIVLTNGAAIDVSYSRIPQAGYTGNNNNINDDPMIESFSEGNLQLYSISPCIDAGDPSSPNDPDDTRANMGNFHSTTDDVTNPVLTTKDATLYLDSEGTGTIQKQDVVENASDNLAVADTSLSRQSFSCADTEAAVLIDVTLTDLYSNSDTEQSSITVLDTISPVITCPGNQYVEAGPGDIYTVSGSEFDPAETGDNCSVAGYQNDYNNLSTLDGAEIPYGTTTIVWTVTDNSGNTKSCSFDVDVSEYTNIYQGEEDKIKVYPNPVRDKLKIINPSGESLNYSIADLAGNMLIKAQLKGNEIDVSSLDEGMYILKINDHIFKIIKE
ncbi:MAG: T9SS type A sorting domain-containing protein [Bacteroidales bacterium]|nr:T9SS type A sorting domain-containing protein [Bacteroidales bacterium]